MTKKILVAIAVVLATVTAIAQNTVPKARPRASDLGLKVGILPTGVLDAITDVAGVEVGQTTIIRGDDLRTGVTAILPHPGNLYRERVPGAVFVGNGFGKLAGSTLRQDCVPQRLRRRLPEHHPDMPRRSSPRRPCQTSSVPPPEGLPCWRLHIRGCHGRAPIGSPCGKLPESARSIRRRCRLPGASLAPRGKRPPARPEEASRVRSRQARPVRPASDLSERDGGCGFGHPIDHVTDGSDGELRITWIHRADHLGNLSHDINFFQDIGIHEMVHLM